MLINLTMQLISFMHFTGERDTTLHIVILTLCVYLSETMERGALRYFKAMCHGFFLIAADNIIFQVICWLSRQQTERSHAYCFESGWRLSFDNGAFLNLEIYYVTLISQIFFSSYCIMVMHTVCVTRRNTNTTYPSPPPKISFGVVGAPSSIM